MEGSKLKYSKYAEKIKNDMKNFSLVAVAGEVMYYQLDLITGFQHMSDIMGFLAGSDEDRGSMKDDFNF